MSDMDTGFAAALPGAGLAFDELYGRLWSAGQLDPQLKEVVRMRNARITDCGL